MFKSPHHALQFAFRTMATPIVKMSSINSMRGSSGNGAMTPHDRHAQAAMIMSIVERILDVGEMAAIFARYRHELQNGEKEREVLTILIPLVIAAFPTGVHSNRGAEKLIRIYFGKEVGQASLRADFKCTNARCEEYKNIAFKTLSDVISRAETKLSIEFESTMIVTNELAEI